MELLEQGAIDQATVDPRGIIEAALKRGAAAVVLAHNHPNTTLTPGEHDKVLARAVVLAAETAQLRVVDHMIVTAQGTLILRQASLS